MESIWQNNVEMPSFSPLCGSIKADVAVVGGGIAGILTAYMLKEKGVSCVLLEKSKLCSGVTSNTTGKITAGHGLIYDKLINRYGIEVAEGYYRANSEAITTLRGLCQNIKCDFQNLNNYVYTLSDESLIEKELRALESIGASTFWGKNIGLPFEVLGAVGLPLQAQFHPLKFLSHIASELEIYENSFVEKVKNGCLLTSRGNVTAENIVICTHFPFINSRGLYFLKLYQHRSYVIALENAASLPGMYIDEATDGLSFRNYGDFLLLGGGGHRTGKRGECFESVRRAGKSLFPCSKEKFAFAAQDCMSIDGMPYIGKYSRGKTRIYVATGFNKWGMSGSGVSAKLLTDEILGVKNDFSDIFSPSRSMIHPQLFINGGESLMGLLYPSAKRCSHLGCALHYNKSEHTWDCSCHGSRFDSSGRVLDNPAQKKIK